MTTGAVLPLVVLVHTHAPLFKSLAEALAEAGAVTATVRTLAVDAPENADERWVLEQARQLLLMATVTAAPALSLEVDDERWEVRFAGQVLHLTTTQFRIVRVLHRAAGRPVLVHELSEAVFGRAYHERDRVAAHVKRLRRRLSEQDVTGYRVETVRGVGYRLVTEHREADEVAALPGQVRA
jgi:DNA-binding winged helix-turn-helix (wHTH) protein